MAVQGSLVDVGDEQVPLRVVGEEDHGCRAAWAGLPGRIGALIQGSPGVRFEVVGRQVRRVVEHDEARGVVVDEPEGPRGRVERRVRVRELRKVAPSRPAVLGLVIDPRLEACRIHDGLDHGHRTIRVGVVGEPGTPGRRLHRRIYLLPRVGANVERPRMPAGKRPWVGAHRLEQDDPARPAIERHRLVRADVRVRGGARLTGGARGARIGARRTGRRRRERVRSRCREHRALAGDDGRGGRRWPRDDGAPAVPPGADQHGRPKERGEQQPEHEEEPDGDRDRSPHPCRRREAPATDRPARHGDRVRPRVGAIREGADRRRQAPFERVELRHR